MSATAEGGLPRLSARGWGYGLAALGAALFSTKAIIIKLAYDAGYSQVDAIMLLGLRMAFALPIYLLIGFWLLRRKAGSVLPGLSAGTVIASCLVGLLGYYLASYLDLVGLMFLTAQLERLVLFTYPLFVMILGAMFFGGRMTRWGLFSIALSYSGIALVYFNGAIADGDNVAAGILFVLAAAFCFALYQLLARALVGRVGSLLFTCMAMSAAATGSLIHFAVDSALSGSAAGLDLAAIPAEIYALAALLSIAATVIPSFMLNAGLERIGAQAVAMIGTLSPIITIFLAIIILGEPFTLVDAAGAFLVIAGIGVFTWRDSRRRVRPAGPINPVSGSAVLHATPDDRS